ncbi:LLM class flavin-dependent oxidoreductase [[Kitasatospora] papulosa]|uniref:LLM class flavin-dependent oxidoreductase n=1 Tax=[Kitasatospora] papulosa TaxID=1464011 RepID=UPI0036AEE2E3
MSPKFLWYIPNTVEPGHRGDDTTAGWGSVEYSTALAHAAEAHGWSGALLGTGWGRPDTFTVATALAARTTTFEPLIAVRPGYWQPAQFAGAAATLDQLSRGRALFNIVSGADGLGAYGDTTVEPARRYARTREFLYLLRRLWTEEDVTYSGEFFQVTGSTVAPRPYAAGGRTHPTLYFGGASPAAERVSAAEAEVQLFWGEPLDGVARRIERLRALSGEVGRRHKPLEYGLRITTLVRDTTEEAWRAAEEKVAALAAFDGSAWTGHRGGGGTAAAPRPRHAGRGPRHLPLHHAGQVRGRRGGDHLAGRFPRRRRHRPGGLPRARHHPLHSLRHPLPAGDRPDRRPGAPPAARRMPAARGGASGHHDPGRSGTPGKDPAQRRSLGKPTPVRGTAATPWQRPGRRSSVPHKVGNAFHPGGRPNRRGPRDRKRAEPR